MNNLFRGRNLINILLLSLGFVLIFFIIVIALFIPAGKEYKNIYSIYSQEMVKLDETQMHHDETMEGLKQLQEKNRNFIMAFENSFKPEAFDALYSKYFQKLTLTQMQALEKEEFFTVYEVNTTSNIHSPNDFYEFLEAVNNSENIIRVEFPIRFVAEADKIHASFRMKVYGANFANYKPQEEGNHSEKEDE